MRKRVPVLKLLAEVFGASTNVRTYYSRVRVEPADHADLERLASLVVGRGSPLDNRLGRLDPDRHKSVMATFQPYEAKSWYKAFARIEIRIRRLTQGIPIKSISIQISTDPLSINPDWGK